MFSKARIAAARWRMRCRPPVAFVHIPRTAGGTVSAWFRRAYPDVRNAGNYLADPVKAEAKVRDRMPGAQAIAGHAPYAVLRKYAPPGTRYLTFLRDPVDRVISHYYWAHGLRQASPAPRRAVMPGATLREALGLRMPELENLATRFLSDDPSRRGELPLAALTEAKANVMAFAVIGLRERFEESMALLHAALDLDAVHAADRHVNLDRPAVSEVPEDLRDSIVRFNRLDVELYAFARQRFEQMILDAGAQFSAKLAAARAARAALPWAVASDDAPVDIRAALSWLDHALSRGTTRRFQDLADAAESAGLSRTALWKARAFATIWAGRDAEGHLTWTRPGDH
jgi:hypothetical protein